MSSSKESHPKLQRRSRATSISNRSSFYNLYSLLLQELGLNHLLHYSPNSSASKNQHSKEYEAKINKLNDSNEQLLRNVLHFVEIPVHLEKFMSFGLLYCLNDFLIAFTILPLKITICVIQFFVIVRNQFLPSSFQLRSPFAVSFQTFLYLSYVPIIQASLLVISLYILGGLDTSKLYHDIRRQSAIKLYVMIGVLDVIDKLTSTIGEDLLKFLYNLQFQFFNKKSNSKYPHIVTILPMLIGSYVLCLVYLVSHSTCLIYQTISFNVAVNSYSNALFTLLLSSQFSEIKSTVFKKFDREGLFQNICSDLTERFQLLTYLFLIGLRNLVEIDLNEGLIPNFWKVLSSSQSTSSSSFEWNLDILKTLGVFLNPTIAVIGSELAVDWIKHSYITKYNHFKPKIYERFLNVLSNDFLETNHYNSDYNSNLDNDLNIQETNYRLINSNRNLNIRIGVPLLALNLIVMKMSWPSIKYFLFDKRVNTDFYTTGSLSSSSNQELSFYQYYNKLLDNTYLVVLILLIYVMLFIVKLITSLTLLRWSNKRKKVFLRSWRKFESSVKKFGNGNTEVLSFPKARSVSTSWPTNGLHILTSSTLDNHDEKQLYERPLSHIEKSESSILGDGTVNPNSISPFDQDIHLTYNSNGFEEPYAVVPTPSASPTRVSSQKAYTFSTASNSKQYCAHDGLPPSRRTSCSNEPEYYQTQTRPSPQPDKDFISNLYEFQDVRSNDYDAKKFSLLAGIGNLQKSDLKYLYDDYEQRQSMDEYRLKNDLKKIVTKKKEKSEKEASSEGGLDNVVRYKMSSKRIY